MSDDLEAPEPRFLDPAATELHAALTALRHGNLTGALTYLRRSLGADPHQAPAHALLSHVLVAQKRFHAAEYEANAALAIDPQLVDGHLALAEVHLARRRLGAAKASFQEALKLDPNETSALRGLARLATVQGRRAEARAELERALALEPNEPETLVALGTWHLDAGQLEEASRYAEEARAVAEGEQDVLVLRGHLALRRGDLEEARDLARWALGQDPTDAGALYLMASLQARESWALGLWWRYSVWMTARGDNAQIIILLLGWFAFRVAELVSRDLGVPALAAGFNYVWLGIAVYSWVGPGLFQRALQKELERVRLRPDF